MSEPKPKLPHRLWAYASIVESVLIRLWALPLVVVGWLLGTMWGALSVGWGLATELGDLEWGVSLLRAHRNRSRPRPAVEPAPEDDDDSLDDER